MQGAQKDQDSLGKRTKWEDSRCRRRERHVGRDSDTELRVQKQTLLTIKLFPTSEPRRSGVGRAVSSTNGAWTTRKSMNSSLHLPPSVRIHSKGVQDLSVRAETTKLRVGSRGAHDLGSGNGFLPPRLTSKDPASRGSGHLLHSPSSITLDLGKATDATSEMQPAMHTHTHTHRKVNHCHSQTLDRSLQSLSSSEKNPTRASV